MTESRPLFSWQAITLRFITPFRVSYGATETRRAFWLRLADDAGWGEGTIPPYYGVAEADMIAYWQRMAERQSPLPDRLEDIPAWVGENGPAPARAALDLALHDRIARKQAVPLFRLLDLPQPPIMATSFTIGIDEPEIMAAQAQAARSYPILKLKLGGDDDVACVAAVRAARPDARLYVDANAAWSAEEAVRNIQAMAGFDLELIEQPTAKADIEGMGYVQRHTDLPVVGRRIGAKSGRCRAIGRGGCARHQSQADEGGWPGAGSAHPACGSLAGHANHARLHDRDIHRRHRRRPSGRAGRLAGFGRTPAGGRQAILRCEL